ncbi:MAG: hypothetical protein ACOYI4_02220 [Christensenellales bacterium]|jgi:hypothetical protein
MEKTVEKSNRAFVVTACVVTALAMVLCVILARAGLFASAANRSLIWFHMEQPVAVDMTAMQERPGSRAQIDSIELIRGAFLDVRGWGVMEGQQSLYKHAYFILASDTEAWQYETDTYIREDVTAHIADGQDYDNSGFGVMLNASNLNPGVYRVWLYLRTGETLCATDCQIEISRSEQDGLEIFWREAEE